MFPSPEILGLKLNWFELITVLSILATLTFGRWYFYKTQTNAKLKSFLLPLGIILIFGYFSTYLMAFLEGQAYAFVKKDTSFLTAFGSSKKFLGFIFFLSAIVFIDKTFAKLKWFNKIADFLAVVVCLFIILETNACLFDGHGCYGRFTNLPWGMYFLHGSAPTLFPVHPTPIYISLSHLLLFGILIYLHVKKLFTNNLILFLLLGTSLFNFLIEFVKDSQPLLIGLNFSQLIYGCIGLMSFIQILKQSNLKSTN